MENGPTPAPPPRGGIPRIHLVFLTLIVLTGLAGGVLMWLDRAGPRVGTSVGPLPKYATIGTHLSAPERTGRTVSTADLKGKVWTVAYTYTRCPRGCLGVVATMIKLGHEFGKNPRFHQVSIAVTPDIDTPEVLNSFMAAQDIKSADRWWFLSGDQAALRGFMTDQLRFQPTIDTPPAQRLSEFDLVEHDLRIGLIDGAGHLRGFYETQNPDPPTAALHLERLRTDIWRLLNE